MAIIWNNSVVQENFIPNDNKQLDFIVAQIHPTPGLTMIGLFANQTDGSVLVSDKINQ